MSAQPFPVRMALCGVGTVGSGVLEILAQNRDFYRKSLGLDFQLRAVAARTPARAAGKVPAGTPVLTDPLEAARLPDIDVFLEAAGGEDAPLPWVEAALRSGKHVVTANKALLAKHGKVLFPLAAAERKFLSFEAAVGGGIPIIRTLQESLIGNDLDGLACIINGTCNFILSRMSDKGLGFEEALREAQERGYAEADPTFDIDGVDALHKVALLASLAYGGHVDYADLSAEGIRHVTALDIATARELGMRIKLLGVVQRQPDGRVLASVYPALLDQGHQLAAVNGVLNAVYLKTSAVGPLLLTGAGAGKLPTASSMVADLVALSQQLATGRPQPPDLAFLGTPGPVSLSPLDDLETEFYLRLTTVDKPGVLSKVTGILGEEGISIRALTQKPEHDPENVPVFILTHTALNRSMARAIARLDALDVLTAPTRALRFYR